MSKELSLISIIEDLYEGDIDFTKNEEHEIDRLIEILNSYKIKTPEDLENKLKESEKSKSTKKPTKKNGPDTSLSKIINEISECFFDSDEEIHVSPEKEDIYTTTLLSLSYLFNLYKIDTINDLKNTLGKSLLTNTFKKSSHTVPEDDMADVMLNLAASYQEAGGSVPSIDEFKNISAFEFIRRIAPNKIRFCVIDKE